jgi:hypothetical protein
MLARAGFPPDKGSHSGNWAAWEWKKPFLIFFQDYRWFWWFLF